MVSIQSVNHVYTTTKSSAGVIGVYCRRNVKDVDAQEESNVISTLCNFRKTRLSPVMHFFHHALTMNLC